MCPRVPTQARAFEEKNSAHGAAVQVPEFDCSIRLDSTRLERDAMPASISRHSCVRVLHNSYDGFVPQFIFVKYRECFGPVLSRGHEALSLSVSSLLPMNDDPNSIRV